MTRRPRWLIVVRRDKPRLYESLRQNFEPDTGVDVILDRRYADLPSEIAERRAPLPGQEDDPWESLGFRLICWTEDVSR